MRKAADHGRGSHTHIADVAEVDARMSALFRRLAAPVAVDMAVAWPATAEVWPERVPDLYLGEPLLLAVKFGEQLPDAPLAVSGRIAGRDWQTTLRWPDATAPDATAPDATAPDALETHPGVASLWARKKIEQLLGERGGDKDSQALRARVLPLALRHQLLSPYTSFVAIEEVVSRSAEDALNSEAVPNTRPAGQAPQTYAYPRTATTAPARIWFASLLLLLAVLVHVCRQEEAYA
jgi:Ca-activated chloride channel family protein